MVTNPLAFLIKGSKSLRTTPTFRRPLKKIAQKVPYYLNILSHIENSQFKSFPPNAFNAPNLLLHLVMATQINKNRKDYPLHNSYAS